MFVIYNNKNIEWKKNTQIMKIQLKISENYNKDNGIFDQFR